jgi:hypothetical protein
MRIMLRSHPLSLEGDMRGVTVNRSDIAAFLDELFEDDVHAKRVRSLSDATLGVVNSVSLAVHAIGQGLAHAQGLLPKHAVKQVDRLLSNRGIDVWAYFAYWVPYVVGARREVVVALDWTMFDRDDQATIALSLLTGHGRATPLLWKTVKRSALKGRQTAHEDALLVRLREVLPAGVAVTVVADRGIADCKLFEFLEQTLGFGYVIRLRGHIYVTAVDGERRAAKRWVGSGGRARTLRGASVTDSHAYPVATVVCVQAKGMAEPWCLVSSDPQAGPKRLLAYYARRWGIEASFRDIKDLRFGMGLSATRISQPARRDRLLFLSALAIALLSLLGAAGEALGYDRMLKANTVKHRTHSLFRQGCLLYDWLPKMRAQYLRPLMERFAQLLKEHQAFTPVFGIL